ncbi:MAG: COX15/CtaA family protein [Myxococcota bacterium]
MARAYSVLALLTVGLMVLGALVRAHGAGLACPDWPLCFGEFIPRFDLKIAFEWSHRVVAGLIALVFLLLAARCLQNPVLRHHVGRLVVVAGLLLVLQILLGALTVWGLLASWSVTSHLLTANAFVVSLVFLAAQLSEQAGRPVRPHTVSRAQLWLVSGTLALLILQVALGGLIASTYAGLVCPDWPTCIDGVWFPGWEGARGLHLSHRVVAYALVGALCGCAIATRSASALGRLLRVALGLGVAQVAVGVANVLLRLPVEVTALHSALAAVLVITLALATREAWLSREPQRQGNRTAEAKPAD